MADKIVDYIILPDNLRDLYFRILKEFSNSTVKDLSIDSESNPVRLFNMFESAIAAYKLNNQKLYKLLIGYIVINLKPIDKMRIFKNANGLWNVDGSIIPAGTLILEPVANSNTVKFLTLNFQVVKQETIDNLLKEDGTPYGTYSAFELATKDFFVKAPIGGADITQLTNDVASLTIKLNNLEIKGVTELLNKPNGIAGLDAAKKLANDVIRTDFRMSQGYILDGVDDYLTAPHNDKLNFGTDDFTIQCNFVISPSNKDERILQELLIASPYTGFSIVKTTFNDIVMTVIDIQGTRTSQPIKNITTTTKINYFCTKSGNLLRHYVNGILVVATIVVGTGSISNSDYISIGAGFGGSDKMSGNVSLVRLFNRALSQSDVTYYENNGRPDLQRLQYADVITNYGELMQSGDNETTINGFGYFDNSIGLAGAYTRNSITPINGSYDARLQVTGSGDNVNRPIVTLPITNKVGKSYLLSFKSKINSGTVILSGISKGGQVIPLNKTLTTGINKFIFDDSFQSDLIAFYLYFDGTQLFDMQLDDFSVKQLGCVLELLPENALPDRWLESQNGLDAIASGSPAINTETPVTDTQIVDNVTNNIAVGTFNRDYTLPAGYLVDSVCVKSTVSLTALQLINVSTSETLLTGKTVSSTAGKHLPITADQSSPTTDTTLRLNATGNTGLGFNIIINIKKCI